MEAPSSRYGELVRVKQEKEPSSEEQQEPVAKSVPKSIDGPDPGPDPKGYTCKQGGVGSNKKSRSGPIARLWSDEDEIAVLNGMIDFTNLNGREPNGADDNLAFYNLVKGKLCAGVSKVQLGAKKRKLKSRFRNALDTGSDPVFSNPHEDMVFQLSKEVWGDCYRSSKKEKKKIEGKEKIERKEKEKEAAIQKEVAKEDNSGEETEFWSRYPALNESFHKMGNFSPSFSMSESGLSFVKERMSLIGRGKAKKLDIKWRELIVKDMEIKSKEMEIKSKEMEIQSKQMEINDEMFALMTEQCKMAFDH